MSDERVRVEAARPSEPGHEDSEAVHAVRRHARTAALAVTQEERTFAVDALARAVEALPASIAAEGKNALLRSLLDDPALATLRDSEGVELRQRLAKVQVGLGFPWALEVNPDHLPPPATAGWRDGSWLARGFTIAVGLCGSLWSATWAYGAAYGAMMDSGEETSGPGVGSALFLAQAVYAALAMVPPISHSLTAALGGKKTLRVYGWLGILSPLIVPVLAAFSHVGDVGWGLVMGAFLGLPAILAGRGTLAVASKLDD